MSNIDCPIQCINRDLICEPGNDFLEKHGSFFLTLFGVLTGVVGLVLTYFIKSRCTEIRCWGMLCKRKPLNLNVNDIEITSTIN
jgi:hypothetical protein